MSTREENGLHPLSSLINTDNKPAVTKIKTLDLTPQWTILSHLGCYVMTGMSSLMEEDVLCWYIAEDYFVDSD